MSIEDGDEPVHCTRGIIAGLARCILEDAPRILHSSRYRVLIRVVHGTRITVDLAFKSTIPL